MKLIYKIEFNSTNLYYKHILESMIEKFSINAVCKQFEGFILIIIDDEAQTIEEFFKYLENNLPLSIFLGKSYVIDEYDETLKEIENKDIKQNLCLLTNELIADILKNNNIDFLNDIVKISKGEISRFETQNGLKKYFLPNKQRRQKAESKGYEVKLLITNLSKIEELFEINMKQMQLLCSIERPLVKLKFKPLKNSEKEFSSTNYIYVKIPYDKETVLFAQALKESGIDFLLYTCDEIYQDGLKVTYFKDRNIIIRGEKGLFPKFDFVANEQFNSSKQYFDKNGGIYKSVLSQHAKRLVNSIGVYFSLNSNSSNISINIPTKGVKEVFLVPNIFNDLNNCFEEIMDIDENCARLITNYKKKFPFVEDIELNSKSNGFNSILNICAAVLGLKDSKEFEDMALDVTNNQGLQIDMKLVNIDGINYLDYRRIVQSIMSYKMGDVSNATLCYSFFESLSEFICNSIDEIVKEFKAKDVVLCGDLFSNRILLEKTEKTLSKSYNILLPTQYPLDYRIVD